jgi:S1-C subfamily serine protease
LDALSAVVVVEHPLGSGSGFVVDKDIVCTNAHMVEHAYVDEIKIHSGAENKPPKKVGRVLHMDRGRDLCLFEVELDPGLPVLKVRGDYAIRAGEQVTLMGNPSVRGGILLRNASNRGRLTALTRIEGHDYYQFDATVNPGWSGGPVIDARGNVIAVVAMKAKGEAVAELRSAMRQMDESCRARFKELEATGITFGIPAGALEKALRAPNLRDASRLAALNDRFTARGVRPTRLPRQPRPPAHAGQRAAGPRGTRAASPPRAE